MAPINGDGGETEDIALYLCSKGYDLSSLEIERLKGDASDRRYYKVRGIMGGGGGGALVLMRILKDTKAMVSHEVTRLTSAPELPFINIQRLYRRLNLPVPEIYHYDREKGMMLLEDLGDTTLEDLFSEKGYKGCRDIYHRAIEHLVRLQVEGTKLLDPSFYAFHQSFDRELFLWEFDHFLENSIILRRGVIPTPSEMETVKAIFGRISSTLAGERFFLCHRDYHSRNIVIRNGEMGILDFQDSLLAPPHYDLASLLLDSYVELPEEGVEELLSFYLDLREEMEDRVIDRVRFREVFDLQCIQRNLKAAGRFDFIDIKKGNHRYLKYIPASLKKARRNLLKYPFLEPLRRVLSGYIEVFG